MWPPLAPHSKLQGGGAPAPPPVNPPLRMDGCLNVLNGRRRRRARTSAERELIKSYAALHTNLLPVMKTMI